MPPAAASSAADQAKPKPAGIDVPAAGWELIGFAGVTLDVAVHAAAALKLEPAPMPERALAADWAEAYELALPAEGTSTYRALIQRLRLRAPGRAPRRDAGQLELGVAA
jgi:hypothetical protein